MSKLDLSISKLGECKIPSPLNNIAFEPKDSTVIYLKDTKEIKEYYQKYNELAAFVKAGPREKIFHDPNWAKAAIITAGGLCPGLNDVIKGLTITLKDLYEVPIVYGIPYGYQGLIPGFGHTPIMLDSQTVDDIHENGGSILGSSRGRQDEKVMVDTLVRMNVNVLFCIGGDGTLRCAHDVAKEIKRRGLSISIVGIPKTIDNDINLIDQTFGFETAVYATYPVITAAHNEAKGAYNGVGLIRVMGRDSGFIAAYAALANSHVNYCLVPEEKFSLENDFLPHLKKRLKKSKHAVIIVAEGAGQEFFDNSDETKDKSGNILHKNIGRFLEYKINQYAKDEKIEVNVKYFDPSYLIRSLPAHGTDAVFCLMLAQNAVHAAMSGCTDVVVGHWNNSFTLVPIKEATRSRKQIETKGSLWRSVKAVTWPDYN